MVEELYTDFYDQLLGWCTARIRSPAAAEDLGLVFDPDLEGVNKPDPLPGVHCPAEDLQVQKFPRRNPQRGGGFLAEQGFVFLQPQLDSLNLQHMMTPFP